jgi:ABC-type antimicrobial peptide transport system permease subunit
LIGIVIGTAGALASARLLSTLVFGVSASDPVTLTAVGGTLALVALLASAIPAYRAAQLDPLMVFRAN